MTFKILALFCLNILFLAGAVTAQPMQNTCAEVVTKDCLIEIADGVIATQDDANATAALALHYAGSMANDAPDHSAALIKTYGQSGDWRSLRRLGQSFARAEQGDLAADFFWKSSLSRAADPNPHTKVLDILLNADDVAELGRWEIARDIHQVAAQQLPGALDGYVPLSDELRLTRLMALFGWPEDAIPILDNIYPQFSGIAFERQLYANTLTRFMEVFILVGRDDLLAQAEVDLAAFLETADAPTTASVHKEHVSALAQGGRIADARALAETYGIDFATAIQSVPHFFLQHGSEYYPGIPQDVLRRYELMIGAIDDPTIKGEFLTKLARQMIQDRHYDGLIALADRLENPAARSEVILSLMTYYARDADDPVAAADLFFSENVNLTPRFPQLGSFLKRYPLSLTARGLLAQGDMERGNYLADLVLQLWIDDQDEARYLEGLLVGALAVADDQQRLAFWLDASDDPGHKLSVLLTAVRARVAAGQTIDRPQLDAALDALLPQISDVPGPRAPWWPRETPVPSPRDDALSGVDDLDVAIAMSLVQQGALEDARAAFAKVNRLDSYPWRVALALATLEVANGSSDAAHVLRVATLDQLLQGNIPSRQMPFVIRSLYRTAAQ